MTHTQLTQLVQALLDAPTSNETVKEFAQSWINAEGTPKQEELTKQLVSVAEQNIALIDETIGFAGSELATQILGAEGAANLLQHAKDIKAEGVNVNIRMYNFDDVQCTVIPSVAYGFVTGMNLQLC